jgi:hypothetical protein
MEVTSSRPGPGPSKLRPLFSSETCRPPYSSGMRIARKRLEREQ